MAIRNAAKAIILHNGKILVNRNQNSIGDMCYGLPNGAIYYDLPGGGQNQYESLEEALQRECLEETGRSVIPERLAAVYEEISTHEQFRIHYEQYAHKINFIFVCRLLDKPIKPLTEKDLDMLDSEWIAMEDMKDIPLYPLLVNRMLPTILESKATLYLGSQRV